MLAPAQESPQDWSDQETLLLLEGMEMYGENWAEIAEHVGTRSQVRTCSHVRSSGLTDAVHSPPPGVAVVGGRAMQGTCYAGIGSLCWLATLQARTAVR